MGYVILKFGCPSIESTARQTAIEGGPAPQRQMAEDSLLIDRNNLWSCYGSITQSIDQHQPDLTDPPAYFPIACTVQSLPDNMTPDNMTFA